MIWKVRFGDGRGGTYVVEWPSDEDPMIPGNTSDGVRVLHHAARATNWTPVDTVIDLRPEEERTLY